MIDKLLKELKEKAKELSDKHWGDDERHLIAKGIQCMYTQSENIIRSKLKDGGWIPCSERLPESFLKVVLVCLKNGAVSVAICGTDGEFINMMVGASRQKFRYFPEHNPVIAWQPLPEAYHG